MVIKRPFQTWAAAAITAALSTSTFADTITLKNGDKIEGKIQSENDKEVVIEERISASITDMRPVPKADIAKIDKEAQDEPAFQAIKNLKPGPNSMPAASYDQITRSLNSFITSFPQSSHVGDVKQQLASWEEEKKRVDAGEVKLNNKWLSKEEAQNERYQINGQVIFNYMQQQYRQQDLVGAMNSFDQLERNYPGARSYPDAVELAKQILPALKSAADRTLQASKAQDAEREKGVQLQSEPQRSQTLAAIQREKQQATAAVEAANKANLKWPPMVRSESALTAITAKIPDEQRRLAEIPVSKLRQSIQLADKAREQLAEKKFDDADATARQSIELWNANELATRLQTDISNQKTASTATPAPAAEEQPAASTTQPASADSNASASQSTDSVSSSENTAEASAADSEEKPAFFKTWPGIVTLIVLAIIALTAFSALKKVSRRSSEVIE